MFEGVPKPAYILPQSDPVGRYNALSRLHGPSVQDVEELSKGKRVRRRDSEDYPEDAAEERKRRRQEAALTESEEALLKKFAQLRGLMNFSLETGTVYTLAVNSETGLVDVVEQASQRVVMSLTPEEVAQLSGRAERYAGRLTDYAV